MASVYSPPRPVEHVSPASLARLWVRALPLLSLTELLVATVLVSLYVSAAPRGVLLMLLPLSAGLCLRGLALVRLKRIGLAGPASRPGKLLAMTSLLLTAGSFALVPWLFSPGADLLDPQLVVRNGVLLAMTLGLTVMAVVCLAGRRLLALGYVALVLGSMAAHLALCDPQGQPLAGGLLLFLLFLVLASQRLAQFSLRMLQYQHRNEALIHYLETARADAEALNSKLALEIIERQQARQRLQDSRNQLETMVQERTQALEATNRRLQLALDASHICLWDWDLTRASMVHVNLSRLLGHPDCKEPELAQQLLDHIHPNDLPDMRCAIVRHFKGQASDYRAVFRMRHADGQWRWMQDEGQVVERSADGRAQRMIGTRRDISDDRAAREQLRLSATVFEQASEAIFILDRHFRFLNINDMFLRTTGLTRDAVLGQPVLAISQSQELVTQYHSIAHTLQQEGLWMGELQERRRNGEPLPQWLQVSAVYDEQGTLTHYVGLFTDLTARKEVEQRVQFLSNYDRLTGFANRSQFRERLQRQLTLSRLNRQPLALLHIDLDRFRPINDSLGYEVGDQLLKLTADRLRDCGFNEEQLARIASDEFTLMLSDTGAGVALDNLCQLILGTLRRPYQVGPHELLLGASVGVSLFPDTAHDAQALVNQADLAMHQAKRAGGNAWRVYVPEMRAASLEQLELETSLRKAIFRDEFVVHYQPKMDIATSRIISAEALVRWQHPQLGLLSPQQFIPLAEETGLICAIGERVLEHACRQAFNWHQDGHGPIRVSVNLSAHQVRKGNVLEMVERVLADTGLPPTLLELELTESLLMEDLDSHTTLMSALRSQGISLSLDDFGTGYSSLSYLKRFPIDTLKIDRTFITELEHSATDAAITRAIIDMAHSLDLKVVAEGVETATHLRILTDMGCDAIQGFLLSRPVPAEQFETLLAAQAPSVHESCSD